MKTTLIQTDHLEIDYSLENYTYIFFSLMLSSSPCLPLFPLFGGQENQLFPSVGCLIFSI